MKLLYTMLKDAYPARGELFLVLGVNFVFRKIWENLVRPPPPFPPTHPPTQLGPTQPLLIKPHRIMYSTTYPPTHLPMQVSVFIDAKSRTATHLLKDQTDLLDYVDKEQLVDWLGGELHYEFVPPSDD